MKNFFGKISEFKNSLKNQAVSTSGKIIENIKKKVAILTTASALGISTPAIATDWHTVNTPGIGPQEFAEKYFDTKNWKGLIDRNGKSVIIPSKDLILGREYTIAEKTPTKSQINQKSQGENITPQTLPNRTEKLKSIQGKKEVIAQKSSLSRKEMLLKGLFSISYGDLMGLNLETYKTAVAGSESNGSYLARNDVLGKWNNIPSGKWAWGKYQFTTNTLIQYGIQLIENGKISENQVQKFLTNPELQESLMEQYTRETLEKIKGNPRLTKIIEEGKKPLPEILAKGHIGGPGSIEHNGKKTDWLNTPITTYAKAVGNKYLSLVASNEEFIQKSSIRKSEIKDTPIALRKLQNIEKISSTVPSANDRIFSIQVTKSAVSNIQNPEIQAMFEERYTPFENEFTAIETDMQKHRNEAIRLRKKGILLKEEAMKIFGPSREKFLKEAKYYEQEAMKIAKVADTLKSVLLTLEKQNISSLQKAA